MKLFIFIFFTSLFLFLVSGKKCENVKNQNFQFHLATKTPYRFVENKNITKLSFPGCKPEQIWMVIRHGTRNPGEKYIKALNRLAQIQIQFRKNIKKSKLCFEDANKLEQWKPPNNLLGREKFLTSEGEKELVELAIRMKQRLPELFPKTFSNLTYLFKYTKSQRTELSAKCFAKGIFGSSESDQVWYPIPQSKDPILRFYKICDKWKYDIDKNPTTVRERKKFEESELIQGLMKNVTERLGLPSKYLTFDDIFYMYSYCAFEIAWDDHNSTSAWCSAFSNSDFEIMEYAEDLEYYWVDGYGYDLTPQLACVMIRDMLHFFDKGIPHGIFYFTHSGTLLKLLAHLGLYKDAKPLTFIMQNDRHWKVSKIDAFGSNIAFVKYSCGILKRPHLLLLHQEQPIRIPGCSSASILCPLKEFLEVNKIKQEFCNFTNMCSRNITNCDYNIKWLLERFYTCFA